MTTTDQLESLHARITQALGQLASTVTTHADQARPTPGHVVCLIEAPDITWTGMANEPHATWRIDLIAGTASTQADSLPLLWQALDLIAAAGINIQDAQPISYSLAGVGSLAAYQATIQ